MDRLSSALGHPRDDDAASSDRQAPPGGVERAAGDAALPAFALHGGDEPLIERASQRLAVPEALLNLAQLDVLYDGDRRALWTFMRPTGRPAFNRDLLGDFESWQALIGSHFGPAGLPLDFLLLGSRTPGVFCFGGDLALFQQLIRLRDEAALASYGHRCVRILHRNFHALDLPMLTIGLVQGQALGGGFEALLSFDVLIAERGATFGLPEVMFGLFPGMGAHSLLSRKVGTALADQIILSNRTYKAEDLYEMGLVAQLAEPGEGIATARAFMEKSGRRLAGMVAAKRAMRLAAPVPLSEMEEIVNLWARAALQLTEGDLKLMSRLAATQARNYGAAA
ncbi:MAG TPA: crotonase/enoyl-CoA hydratase family protein [Novosphingobium sp.]|nr:crotonase/enoyl-CoA hydratase family protein [Novosphingobium sp.]